MYLIQGPSCAKVVSEDSPFRPGVADIPDRTKALFRQPLEHCPDRRGRNEVIMLLDDDRHAQRVRKIPYWQQSVRNPRDQVRSVVLAPAQEGAHERRADICGEADMRRKVVSVGRAYRRVRRGEGGIRRDRERANTRRRHRLAQVPSALGRPPHRNVAVRPTAPLDAVVPQVGATLDDELRTPVRARQGAERKPRRARSGHALKYRDRPCHLSCHSSRGSPRWMTLARACSWARAVKPRQPESADTGVRPG